MTTLLWRFLMTNTTTVITASRNRIKRKQGTSAAGSTVERGLLLTMLNSSANKSGVQFNYINHSYSVFDIRTYFTSIEFCHDEARFTDTAKVPQSINAYTVVATWIKVTFISIYIVIVSKFTMDLL